MDFTSTFKQNTKAGKSFKKKANQAKKKAGQQNGDGKDYIPQDTTDNVNKDLEDANFIHNDAFDIIYDPE